MPSFHRLEGCTSQPARELRGTVVQWYLDLSASPCFRLPKSNFIPDMSREGNETVEPRVRPLQLSPRLMAAYLLCSCNLLLMLSSQKTPNPCPKMFGSLVVLIPAGGQDLAASGKCSSSRQGIINVVRLLRRPVAEAEPQPCGRTRSRRTHPTRQNT